MCHSNSSSHVLLHCLSHLLSPLPRGARHECILFFPPPFPAFTLLSSFRKGPMLVIILLSAHSFFNLPNIFFEMRSTVLVLHLRIIILLSSFGSMQFVKKPNLHIFPPHRPSGMSLSRNFFSRRSMAATYRTPPSRWRTATNMHTPPRFSTHFSKVFFQFLRNNFWAQFCQGLFVYLPSSWCSESGHHFASFL